MRAHWFVRLILFLLLFGLGGCSFSENPGASGAEEPTLELTQFDEAGQSHPEQTGQTSTFLEDQTLPGEAGRTLTAPTRLPLYIIDVRMDYEAKTLDVKQEIELPNTSAVEIVDILLAVQPNRIPGVFNLVNLRLDGRVVSDYTLNGQRLQWKSVAPIRPGQTAQIQLEYRLELPKIKQADPKLSLPQIFGVTTRQVNLTDWYPMLVPFEPKSGWRLADPWLYGEHLVYPLANFDVTLRFVDRATAPVIAASALAQPAQGGGQRYFLKNGRDFVLAMSRQFRVVSAEVEGVTVASYFFPGNESGALAVLDATGKSLKMYNHLFGPYPHRTLAAVQGDFNDGMEFDGLYYLSNSFYNLYTGSEQDYLVMIAAHETSHQWWFGRVASDQANQPWLDEALATYCEKLFYEQNYLGSVRWWWTNRIDFYNPVGKIDGDVPSYGGFSPYTDATYRQGARFYDELRQMIGDQAFFAFLKDYATQMDGQIATSGDFFRILREHSAVDLSRLLSKYFATHQ